MEQTYQTKTIILDKKPFREYDAKVTAYSLGRGKLELVVRGAQRIKSKLAGHLEPITLANVMIIQGRQFDYVGSAFGENYFTGIKNNLDKLYSVGQAIMIFKKMVKENERDAKLFQLLEGFLELLNINQLSVIPPWRDQLSANFFILKLLVNLGYKPQLYNCVVCKRRLSPGGNRFDAGRGGTVCQNCSRPTNNGLLTISDNCLKVLRLAVNEGNDFKRLVKLKLNKNLIKEVQQIIGSFLKFYI